MVLGLIRCRLLLVVVWAMALLVVRELSAAEKFSSAKMLDNLRRPTAIAVRPGGTAARYEVMVAERGAGRVLRWSNVAPQEVADVVTGFSVPAADGQAPRGGLAALLFLDPGLLLVGTTSDAGGGLVRGYELIDERPLAAGDSVGSDAHREQSPPGSTCISLTRVRPNAFVADQLVLAVRLAENDVQLRKARLQAGMVGKLQPAGAENPPLAPLAVAISTAGSVVVGDTAGVLHFLNPIDGRSSLTVSTEIKQFAALAYSPSGSLYAADFAGGIYRIEDASTPGRPACRTVRVLDVAQPTGLAFAPDGAMYVIAYGAGVGDGSLAVVTGDL